MRKRRVDPHPQARYRRGEQRAAEAEAQSKGLRLEVEPIAKAPFGDNGSSPGDQGSGNGNKPVAWRR